MRAIWKRLKRFVKPRKSSLARTTSALTVTGGYEQLPD